MGKKITKRFNKRLKKGKKTRRKKRKQRGGQIPDPVFPQKEDVLQDLGEWNSINCLKYKRGKVMIIENNLDSNKIASCELFKISTTVLPNILYQYILYKTGKTDKSIKILLSPTYASPEIGTKHKCLLQRIPDGAFILASGELLRRDDTIFYSCVSSLFFQHLMKFLYPKVSRREKNSEGKNIINVVRENFEENIVINMLRNALPGELRIIYVKNIEKNGESKGARDDSIPTGPLDVLTLNPERFCDLPIDKRPDCLKYVTDDQCESMQMHPGKGYCGVGVDFCDNREMETPPETLIPESEYIYDKKIDADASRAYLEKKGITPPSDKWMTIAQAKRVAGEKEKHELYKEKQVWPRP